MSNYEYIFFDFDGTIVDTGLGIINSIEYALNEMNYEIKNRENLKKFIGPPLNVSFKEFCRFDEKKTEEAINLYRKRYSEKGLYEVIKYDGLEDLLIKLKANKKKIVIATSKPEPFTEKILKHLNFYKYFDFLAGSTLKGERNSKTEVIKYALDSMKITDIRKVVMIGDRKYDIEGANNLNVDSIGVLYGYGSFNELSIAGATYIKETPQNMCEILL